MDESGIDEVECSRKVASGRVAVLLILGVCSLSVLWSLAVTVLTYGSEIMIWKEKQSSRIKAVNIEILRNLLGIRRMDKIPNARVALSDEQCGRKN